MSSTKPQDGVVAGPQISTMVVVKFMFFSALMVATPTAVFFLSHYRYLDCALPRRSAVYLALIVADEGM